MLFVRRGRIGNGDTGIRVRGAAVSEHDLIIIIISNGKQYNNFSYRFYFLLL